VFQDWSYETCFLIYTTQKYNLDLFITESVSTFESHIETQNVYRVSNQSVTKNAFLLRTTEIPSIQDDISLVPDCT
jgi:hypothetical protein